MNHFSEEIMNYKSLVTCALLAISLPDSATDADERVAIVAELYKDYAWEVVIFRPAPPEFIDQPKP